MRVVVPVPEAKADRVKRGDRARILVEALGPEAFEGVVEAVAPLPDPSPGSGPDTGPVYSTRVAFERAPAGLRPGMAAEARIEAVEAEDALVVPVGALVRLPGRVRVAVKTPGGGVEWRPVVLGPTDGKSVMVTWGLRAGEAVVLDPDSAMTEAERKARILGPGTAPR